METSLQNGFYHKNQCLLHFCFKKSSSWGSRKYNFVTNTISIFEALELFLKRLNMDIRKLNLKYRSIGISKGMVQAATSATMWKIENLGVRSSSQILKKREEFSHYLCFILKNGENWQTGLAWSIWLTEQPPSFRCGRTCWVSQTPPSHGGLIRILTHFIHSPYLRDSCRHSEFKNLLLWFRRQRTHCGLAKNFSWLLKSR